MSDDTTPADDVDPQIEAANALLPIGFLPIDPVGLLSHADGRVAAVARDGRSQIFFSLADAQRWLDSFGLNANFGKIGQPATDPATPEES
jgi:hypothetical protein